MENNHNNAANILSNRLAKSLLRFLRPIRVGFPRSAGDPKPKHHSKDANGNLLEFKAIAHVTPITPRDSRRPPQKAAEESSESPPLVLDDKKPGQWLDLVVHLLAACKKATSKIRTRRGVASYQKEVGARGNARIKAIGSIVDTMTVIQTTSSSETVNEELPLNDEKSDKKAS